ncbi:MAG: SusD/RagB family nutrient-binding outer membrane lipoprotein [Candidatus Pseudobacter hemicellulosilyticus]|uniref:SusD/RagB family nutrient-binding outer membrane lipoprotein n=1 Tax=Candidatus Pseudobacter hemicellulosilyticus TaxID=3121375 RepID=A0AAJ5WNC0_9BACT|nr:MAG: SusD/RagB family nutrient-binding outer membrane lipoprotein [Pseudobacter sp.]
MKKHFFRYVLLLLVLGSCTKDFEEMNTNPNRPDQLTDPGLLLPDLIRSVANKNLDNSFDRGAIAADQLATSYASNFSNWFRADAQGYFNWSYYNYIRDLNEVIRAAEERGYNNYKGIALVLRAWLFQNLTDLYGPIPFREASAAGVTGVNRPKYAQQQDVYAGLITDLEEAAGLLGSTGEGVTGDILFSGSIDRWKKFNTGLLLRILLRQSNKVDPTTKMTAILNNGTQYPLFQGYSEQAALQYLTDRDENNMPLYHASNSDYGISSRVTASLVSRLNSMNDARLFVFALPASQSGNYTGAVNGTGDWDDPAKYSPPGMLWAPRQYNATLASTTAAQSILLSYSEVQFTLAEAAERGFIPGGSGAAETYYTNGINDQFSYYASRIPSNYTFPTAADIVPGTGYFDQSTVAYTGNQAQKLEKIYLQKWLSLFLVGYEAWTEWRRTGYPAIVAGPVSPGYVPSRVLYPADEQTINADNYREAVQWLGGSDALNTKLWFAK